METDIIDWDRFIFDESSKWKYDGSEWERLIGDAISIKMEIIEARLSFSQNDNTDEIFIKNQKLNSLFSKRDDLFKQILNAKRKMVV